MILTRDQYIDSLEKRAAQDCAPDYTVDSQAVANKEQDANRADQAKTLKGLFDNTGKAQKADSKLVDKLLPKSQKGDADTSSPLLKVASSVVGIAQAEHDVLFLKHASPEYLDRVLTSFITEVSKIEQAL